MTSNQNGENTPKKKSVSEKGNAINIANFLKLITFCLGYGAWYNPVKEALKAQAIQNLHRLAQSKLENVNSLKKTFDTAVYDRKIAFASLKSLAAKVVNAFAVSGANELEIENAKSILLKIRGTSNKKNNLKNATSSKSHSTSQQSFDFLLENFSILIKTVQQNPNYRPNETSLQVSNLLAILSNLQTTIDNHNKAYTNYSNARIERNHILYHPQTGLVQIAKEIKLYVKSVYGSKSPEYLQISSIKFTTQNIV